MSSYVYRDKWEADEDGYRDSVRAIALEGSPHSKIVGEKTTCPVPGVDDPEVMMVEFEFEKEDDTE